MATEYNEFGTPADRELRRQWDAASAEVHRIKRSVRPANVERRRLLARQLDAIRNDWKTTLARKRAGEMTDPYAYYLVEDAVRGCALTHGLRAKFGRVPLPSISTDHIDEMLAFAASPMDGETWSIARAAAFGLGVAREVSAIDADALLSTSLASHRTDGDAASGLFVVRYATRETAGNIVWFADNLPWRGPDNFVDA